MAARTLMIQGVASSVGKSIVVTALLRYFRNRGVKAAPFKAQNMALNSFVTADGREIGRAQAVQAEAAGVEPVAEMNPVLLKPEGERRSQVIAMGRPIGSMTANEYFAFKPRLKPIVAQALQRLQKEFELIIIEGAGSPAEINLKAHDLVNMHVARLAQSPVVLVGDIDRGGVFASLVGTLELLEPDERSYVKTLLINRFRGERRLLDPGLEFLRQRTGLPVLGVVPYLDRLMIAEEDSASLDRRPRGPASPGRELAIAVVRLPRISNFDDVMPLEAEAGVSVSFTDSAGALMRADLCILPGSKSTIADLAWLREAGLAEVILMRAKLGFPVMGICGGCQMLGCAIEDPHGVESTVARASGLGLLPLVTRFEPTKLTAQVEAVPGEASFLTQGLSANTVVKGYEIHAGMVTPLEPGVAQPFRIIKRNASAVDVPDGGIGAGGAVVGTMLHGIFHNDEIRHALLMNLRARRDEPRRATDGRGFSSDFEYERLARTVAENIDLRLLERLVGLA